MLLDQGESKICNIGTFESLEQTLIDAFDESVRTFMGTQTSGYRFFLSRKLFMGLGPEDLAAGDEIHVLSGASVPFVLRKKGENYRLIGEAYVHGLMYGQDHPKARLSAQRISLC